MDKLNFKGTITSIQPRIRLTRSFDEAYNTYSGYAIKIAGTIDGEETISLDQNIATDQTKTLKQTTVSNQTTFTIGIGKAAHAKHQCAPCMARNLAVKVRYGGWQLPTISQAQGCPRRRV